MSQALPPAKPQKPELRKTTIVKLNMTKLGQLIRKDLDTRQDNSIQGPPTTVSLPPGE